MLKEVKIGIYLHYKGNKYEVIGIARDSENLKEKVVYKALYNSPDFGENAIWVRDKEEFCSSVSIDGKEIPRFVFLAG